MADKFSIDQALVDPDSIERFKQYGSPDPENIDRQLLREYRKNSHIKSSGKGFTDVLIASILVLIAAPLAYVVILAVIHFGWVGLIVGIILSPLFAAAGVFIAGLFQR